MDSLSDEELVRRFLAAVGSRPGTQIAEDVPGISAQDVSRWRRSEWEWLSGKKRAALEGFLRRYEAARAQRSEYAEGARYVIEQLAEKLGELRATFGLAENAKAPRVPPRDAFERMDENARR